MMENQKQEYERLFSADGAKAAAFDQLAERFYAGNFGTMQKSDIETLMFSIYLERLLAKSEEDMDSFGEYKLSKALGITQSKARGLLVKKQLQYPREFDWKARLAKLSETARYEDGKIWLSIPDPNLYAEIKYAIEETGGMVHTQRNGKLLTVRPEYFIDLMLLCAGESDEKEMRRKLREEFRKKNFATEYMDKMTVGAYLKENAGGAAINIVVELLDACSVPLVGGAIKVGLKHVARLLSERT